MMNETKRTWVRPQANVQTFQMNDYVSACYEVYCWTPDNNSRGNVYEDTNNNRHLDKGVDRLLARDVVGDGVSEFTGTYPQNNGFWVRTWLGRETSEVKPIFIYYGKAVAGGLSVHGSDLSDLNNSNAVRDISTPEHPNRS